MPEPTEPDPTPEPTPEPAPEAPKPGPPPTPADPAPEPTPAPEPKTYDEDYVKKLRDEAAARRVEAKTAAEEARKDLAQQIGKAIGLVEDDKPADPEALMQQLTTKDGELKKKTVELALVRTALKHGADIDALTDSRAFMRTVEDLDHASESFMADLESAIKDALAANPNKFKKPTSGQAPPRSGSDLPGGPGEHANTDPESLSIDEHRKARRKARGLDD